MRARWILAVVAGLFLTTAAVAGQQFEAGIATSDDDETGQVRWAWEFGDAFSLGAILEYQERQAFNDPAWAPVFGDGIPVDGLWYGVDGRLWFGDIGVGGAWRKTGGQLEIVADEGLQTYLMLRVNQNIGLKAAHTWYQGTGAIPLDDNDTDLSLGAVYTFTPGKK